jgi:hypothetical protein
VTEPAVKFPLRFASEALPPEEQFLNGIVAPNGALLESEKVCRHLKRDWLPETRYRWTLTESKPLKKKKNIFGGSTCKKRLNSATDFHAVCERLLPLAGIVHYHTSFLLFSVTGKRHTCALRRLERVCIGALKRKRG